MHIKERFIRVVKATQNPTAPLTLQAAFSATEQVGKLFAPLASEAQTQEISNTLLAGWDDEELGKVCHSPEFIMALAAMLSQSLVSYVQEL